jgi:hypothetical protein
MDADFMNWEVHSEYFWCFALCSFLLNLAGFMHVADIIPLLFPVDARPLGRQKS